MSINLTDGMSTSGGSSMSPQIFSGSMEFTLGQLNQLSPASTQFNLIGDFTIEAWLYPTSYLSGGWGIFDARVGGGSSAPWSLGLSSAGNLAFFDGNYYSGPGVVELNVWTHIAYVRYGTDLNFYINGVLDATFTIGTGPISPGSTSPVVGTKDYGLGGYGTVGNISNLRLVKGLAVYTSAFTPSTSPLTVTQPADFNGSPSSIIYPGQTVLLLNSDDNGFNFLDRSQNNFTLTGPRMVQPSPLTPFSGSMLFNGTSDIAYVATNPAFGFGTGDFTVEGWYNFNSFGIDNALILLGTGANGGANYSAWWMRYSTYGGGFLAWYRYDGSAEVQYIFPITLNTGQWYHIACTRSGTDLRFFVNGTQVDATQTCTTDYTIVNSDPLQIGKTITGNGTFYLDGKASNIRVVKGVGVYTSNFITPSNILSNVQGENINGFPSSAISSTQTSLLLNTIDNNTLFLVDSSLNHFTLSVGTGGTTPAAINPFLEGGLFFDTTTGQKTLVVPTSTLLDQNVSFTIECWIYPKDFNQSYIWSNSQYGYLSVGIGYPTGKIFIDKPGIGIPLESTDTFAPNFWYHIALVYNGTTTTLYVNGVNQGSLAGGGPLASTTEPLYIGNYFNGPYSNPFNGYMSNFRFVKGIAVYTSNFTPSTTPLTSTQLANVNGYPSAAISGSQTSLLLNTNNDPHIDLIDSSTHQIAVTGLDMPVPGVGPFAGSILFNGSNDCLLINGTPGDAIDLATGAPNWTIETWFYVNSIDVSNIIFIKGGRVSQSNGSYVLFIEPGGQAYWIVGDGGGGGVQQSAGIISTNTWYHFALVRDSNTLTSYLNGVQTSTVAISFTMGYAGNKLSIGSDVASSGATYFNGYISNFRIVKGLAVYTTDFTISTKPLTSIQLANVNGNPSAAITGTETSLLLNTPNDSLTYLYDSSSYLFPIIGMPNMPSSSVSNPFTMGSLSFNGTSRYLSVPAATGIGNPLDLGTGQGDWTVECWFNGTNLSPGGYGMQPLIAYGWMENVTNPSYGIFIYLGQLCFNISDGGGSYAAIGLPITLSNNVWYHTALVRQGGSAYCFLNGVLSYTLDISSFDQGGYNGFDFAVGTQSPQTPYGFFNGYMSNIRIVKGIAVYTSNFTPSTHSLTATQLANENGYPSAAISGNETSLLLNTNNNSNYLTDNSSYQYSVLGPNMPTTSAMAPLMNGSLSFNGSSDYLTVASNTIFDFGTGDFTIEAWINPVVIATYDNFIYCSGAEGYGGLMFGFSAGGQLGWGQAGILWEARFDANGIVILNQWNHVALIRSGTDMKIFVNGTQLGTTVTNAIGYGELDGIIIGGYPVTGDPYYFNGYMSNIRVVKGIAVYTSNFTPSITPLTSTQVANENGSPSSAINSNQTSLLLNAQYNSTYLVDGSSWQNIVLSPNMPDPIGYTPFAAGSLNFNGTTQALDILAGDAGPSGTEDFTVEFWTNQPYNYSTYPIILQGDIGGGLDVIFVNTVLNIGALTTWLTLDMSTYANQWIHLAITRSADTVRLFINGVQMAVNTNVTDSMVPQTQWALFHPDGGGPAGYLSNFRIVRGIAVYTSSFTPPTNPLTSTQLANVNGNPSAAISGTETSLLLNTPNNNKFLIDSSSYEYSVVATDMPVPDASTPVTGGGSSLFNGTSDYLTVASNTAFEFGTGDFTIETWVYFPTVPSNNGFWQLAGSYWSGIAGLAVGYNAGDWTVYYANTSSGVFGSAGMVANTWIHVALVRNSNALTLYINGTGYLVTSSDTTDYNFTTNLAIGGYYSTSYLMTGYISNLRIVNGIAVYTTDFTPSTTPLTATQSADVNGYPSAAITGTETSLLLNTPNNNYNSIDTSSYNFVVNSSASPLISDINPSIALGSASFNGTTSYLAIDSATELGFGTGDYTIEFWVNFTSIPDIVSFYNTYYGNFFFQYNPGGAFQTGVSGYAVVTSFGFTPVTNTWYHVAVTRSSSTTQCWVNGTQIDTPQTDSVDYGQNGATVGGGGPGSQVLNGYLSNFRVVKGLAVYTTDFTPSTTPLTSTQLADINGIPSAAISGTETSLLLNTYNSGLNRVDSSSYNFLVTSANTPLPDPLYFLSEGSMLFNYNYLYPINNPNTAFASGTGDFTCEAWVYVPSAYGLGTNVATVAGTNSSRSNYGWQMYFSVNGFGIRNYSYNIVLPGGPGAAGLLQTNTWYHVAYTRQGNLHSTWLNGVFCNSDSNPVDYSDGYLRVGSSGSGAGTYDNWNGYISNFRYVKGIAVYTTDFTPSTRPLTATQVANENGSPSSAITGTETSLLLNTPNNTFNLVDSSSYNFITTSTNTPQPTSLEPFTTGSMLFNGTSQYIVTPVSSTLTPTASTTPMTIEAWIYPQTYTNAFIVCNTFSGGTIPYALYLGGGVTPGTPGGKVVFATYNGAGNWNGCVTTANVTISAWTHVAAVFDGTNMSIYINGVQSATVVQTLNTGGTNQVQIGKRWDYGELFTGYISNVRIVNGIAVYTTNFTPSTTSLTSTQAANVNGYPSAAITGTETSLLLNTISNTYFRVDSSSNNFIVNSPGIPTPEAANPIAGSAKYEVGEIVSLENSNSFDLMGDFTIEAWVYPTTLLTNWGIFDARVIGGFSTPWVFLLGNTGSSYVIYWFDGSAYYGTGVVPLNAWTHVAVVRVGETLTFYLNGEVDNVISYTSGPISPGSTSAAVGTKDYVLGGYGTVGNISNLRVVNGIAVYTSAFTPSTGSLTSTQDINVNGYPSAAITGTETVLLLNTPDSQYFRVDSSSNNFYSSSPATPSSTVTNPYILSGSTLFNGTSDYLTVADNAALQLSTGTSFTIEAWIYPTDLSAADHGIVAKRSAGSAEWQFNIHPSYGYLTFWDGVTTYQSDITLYVNNWYHVAVTWDTTTLRFFVNGVIGTTYTGLTLTPGNNDLTIGAVYANTGLYTGNISNLRIVNGIAVYTTDFTPSTHPLTSTQSADVNGIPSAAISGTETSLLLNTPDNIYNITDSSSYNFLVVGSGSPTPSNLSPTFTNEGSAASVGYQYLQIPHSSYGNLFDQDGAFTIECWFYQTSYNPYGTFVWCQDVNFGDTWRCFYGNGYFGCSNYVGGGITSAPIFGDLNTWYHIALSSDGTTTRLFVNGTFQGSYAGTGIALTQDMPFQIGWANYNGPYSYGFSGNISNFRFVKGVAVYTTAFIPPTNDLTATQVANQNGYPSAAISSSQTSLLLNTTNDVLNHIDRSVYNLVVTTPDTPLPTYWNPYNLGSMSFNGSTDYLEIASNLAFNQTGAFTIECWIYPNNVSSGYIWGMLQPGFMGLAFNFGNLIVDMSFVGPKITSVSTLATSTWYHIAVVSTGTTTTLYINGVAEGSFAGTGGAVGGSPLTIGTYLSPSNNPYYGDISNFRIVKGVAVYTGNFTPPSQPLGISQDAGANISPITPLQTSLLLNSPDSPNNLLDTSINNFTVTPNGTPSAIVNNPFGPL